MTLTDTSTITPTPGYYPSMGREQYDSIEAWNYSTLKHGLKSMKQLQWYMNNKPEATAAMQLGTATHLAILEPQRFVNEVVLCPDFDRRTKAGKDAAAVFAATHAGLIPLDADEMDKVCGMAAAINANPSCVWALNQPAHTEATCVWHDPDTGLLCKARLDRVTSDDLILDPKTTRSVVPSDWSRSVAQFAYHLQAAFYIEGLTRTRGGNPAFAWLAVESSAPYDAVLFDIEPDTLHEGRALFRRLLANVKRCLSTNRWPGISDNPISIGIPQWSMTSAELETDNGN